VNNLWIPSRLGTLLASTAWTCLVAVAAAHAQEDRAPSVPADEDAIRAVVEGFHGALSTGDSTRAIGYLHPDLVVYEGGHAETLDEYRSGHLAGDIAFSGAVEFTTTRDAVISGRDNSLYLREYSITGTYRDRAIDARGVETIALARTGEGWKIRHIHWSSR
jgi:ketosteroid isomerase-like protein